MEQLTLEQAATNHSRRSCVTHVELNRTAEEIDNIAFQAGAEWQKEQVIDILLLTAHFVMNATAQQWDIDHYKEKFIALLKPLQDQNLKLLQD